MKSLSEIIKAIEMCSLRRPEDCYGCPYCDGEMEYGSYVFHCDNMKLDALYYLKILKAKSEEPSLGNPPNYIPLNFHQLAEMIGEPVYIKEQGCKGHWEIITAVRKNLDGEDYAIRGNDRWQRIGDCIYRTKEGAHENA